MGGRGRWEARGGLLGRRVQANGRACDARRLRVCKRISRVFIMMSTYLRAVVRKKSLISLSSCQVFIFFFRLALRLSRQKEEDEKYERAAEQVISLKQKTKGQSEVSFFFLNGAQSDASFYYFFDIITRAKGRAARLAKRWEQVTPTSNRPRPPVGQSAQSRCLGETRRNPQQ